MNNSNKTTRGKAIVWWNKLSDTKRRKLTFQYMADMPRTFAGIADENEITGLYISEHPETVSKTPLVEVEEVNHTQIEKEILGMKEENKLLRESNERMKEALEKIVTNIEGCEEYGLTWAEKQIKSISKEALQANPNT